MGVIFSSSNTTTKVPNTSSTSSTSSTSIPLYNQVVAVKPLISTAVVPINTVSSTPSIVASSISASITPATTTITSKTTLSPTAYGETYFFVFMCVILSRLAYEDEAVFVLYYNIIFKYLIPVSMLIQINDKIKYPTNNLKDLEDEETMFNLEKGSNATATKITTISEYLLNYDYKINSYFNPSANMSRIQFIPIAKRINYILNELTASQSAITDPEELEYCTKLKNLNPPPNQLRFVTINTSNYGTIYIMRDIRMPNMIFIIFRGTNSLKSGSSYANTKSISPLWISDLIESGTTTKEKYLEGIYKLLNDTIHLLMDAIAFLSSGNDLNSIGEGGIKIITTGHSLGGGLCTLFSTLVETHIKKHIEAKPNELHFKKIYFKQIGCISVAAPRVMSTEQLYKTWKNILY